MSDIEEFKFFDVRFGNEFISTYAEKSPVRCTETTKVENTAIFFINAILLNGHSKLQWKHIMNFCLVQAIQGHLWHVNS